MGMTKQVATGDRTAPWPTIAKALAGRGLPVQMRLIDGQLAFPDEQPPEGWRELRVASAGRMVTIRRSESGIDLVCWGNADDASLALRDAIAQAFLDEAARVTEQ